MAHRPCSQLTPLLQLLSRAVHCMEPISHSTAFDNGGNVLPIGRVVSRTLSYTDTVQYVDIYVMLCTAAVGRV